MSLIKKILFWTLIFIVVLAGAVFALRNLQMVSIDLVLTQFSVPFSLLIVVTFVVGGVLGLLVGSASLFKAHATNTLLKQKVNKLESSQKKESGSVPVRI